MTTDTALAVAAAGLGLLIGSFLNVVIWRVPRGESVVSPGSRCPRCETPVATRDNVPVVSWLLLRGRCRHCSEPISARYPLVELTTAAVFGVIALAVGPVPALPAFLYLGAVGVALALIDIDTRKLPDVLTLPSYAVAAVALGAAAVADHDASRLLRAAEGGAALYALFFLLWFAYPAGMGFGDVKLSGVLGAYLGWLGWGPLAVGAFSAFLLGGLVGLGLMVAGRAGRKSAIPFGPYLLVGALLAIAAGHAVADAYVRLTLPA